MQISFEATKNDNGKSWNQQELKYFIIWLKTSDKKVRLKVLDMFEKSFAIFAVDVMRFCVFSVADRSNAI